MTLRAHHQSAMSDLAQRIKAEAPIREIFASVTPGGGKSALPPILADTLIGNGFDSIVWVVPRNSLRSQGEADYGSWAKRTRIRAADNEGDPRRGLSGYVTTYQAIVANPELHQKALRYSQYILFLDEPHHIQAGGAWDKAIRPLVDGAGLVVYASGTFARGDGQRIAGLEYGFDGLPDFTSRPGSALIEYTRGDALREGAILPVSFRYLDGRTEWEEDGELRSADSLEAGDYSPAALFTALRTEYALQLLDETVSDWKRQREEVYPNGKLLVVSPNIKLAEVYRDHLHRRRIDSLIATSADDRQAQEAIARFKGLASPSTDILVTVAMAYEGLSVPAVSHIACLTHIRSVPWLEQCFARANRVAQGKVGGYIYGPNDPRFRAAIRAIEAEQVQALRESDAQNDMDESEEGGTGNARQRIQPLRSEAIGCGPMPLFDEAPPPDGGLPSSQAEKLLRHEIDRHIEIVVGRRRPGSRAALNTVIMKTLKNLVGGKSRGELTVEELTAQWVELKRRWPV